MSAESAEDIMILYENEEIENDDHNELDQTLTNILYRIIGYRQNYFIDDTTINELTLFTTNRYRLNVCRHRQTVLRILLHYYWHIVYSRT